MEAYQASRLGRFRQQTTKDRIGSISGTIRLGRTIGSHWLLGWEGSGWLRNNATSWLPAYAGADQTLGNSSLVALFYPSASSGCFVRAGAGVSMPGFSYGDCIDYPCSTSSTASGVGFGIVAGLGYDLRVGRNKSLTPELAYARGLPARPARRGRAGPSPRAGATTTGPSISASRSTSRTRPSSRPHIHEKAAMRSTSTRRTEARTTRNTTRSTTSRTPIEHSGPAAQGDKALLTALRTAGCHATVFVRRSARAQLQRPPTQYQPRGDCSQRPAIQRVRP